MVRRRVEIKPIEDKAKRHTTFTKRRQGLMKKTQDFATKFDAQAAVITFSKAGNVFAFGHPSVDSLVNRYLAEPSSESDAEARTASGGGGMEEEERPAAAESLTEGEAGRRTREALEKGSWSLAVEGLGPREIDEVTAEIVKIKRVVVARASEITARATVLAEARAMETEARSEENNSPDGGVSGGGWVGI